MFVFAHLYYQPPKNDLERERRQKGPFGNVELPSFEVTNYGLKARFPVAEVEGITVVVLLCETATIHLGLLLHEAEESELVDPSRTTFYVTWAFKRNDQDTHSLCRICYLGEDLYDLRFRGHTLKPVWRDIYIRSGPRYQESMEPSHLVLRFTPDRNPPFPFRVPRWTLSALSTMRIQPTTGTVSSSSSPSASWHVWVSFGHITRYEGFAIAFGLCKKAGQEGKPVHWARATPRQFDNWSDFAWRKREHDCHEEHICDWTGMGKDFGPPDRRIRLEFAECPFAPATTLVLYLNLSGRVYEEMVRTSNVTFPPRPATGAPGSIGALTAGISRVSLYS